MVKRLTKTGNSLALVLDRRLLELTKIDDKTLLEVSTDGEVIVISPVRRRQRTTTLRKLVVEAHRQYGGVFKRLADA